MAIDVLLVDDSEADAHVIRRRLAAAPTHDFRLRHVSDASAAWELLSAQAPDCLLLDYRLERSNGLELLARIREANLDLPVIAVTGEGSEDVAVEALKLGAGDYMPKSRITTESLTRSILNVIEKADLQRRLRKQQSELQNFVSVVAHDLQQPLTAVRGSIEVLRDFYGGLLDAQGREMLETAVRTNLRMSAMVDALLSYSRLGRVAQRLVPVRLDDVLEGVRRNLAKTIADSRGRLETEPLPVVLGDEMALVRLFQNLVANGLKFHGDDPPAVTVRARQVGDRWRIEVRDNGIGIDPARRSEIFLPFRRLHKNLFPGSGVGLATCARIVEQHQGEIEVESQPGQGSAFLVTLHRPPAGDMGRRPRNGRSILLVDDEPSILTILRELLERDGFTVETAASVAEARAIQMDNRVDLLVTDLILSGESGFDLIRRVRQRAPSLPIIAISGGGGAGDHIAPLLERADELGAARTIGKPFDGRQLLEAVHELLARAPAAPHAAYDHV